MAWYNNDNGLPNGARVESFCIDDDDQETAASAEARLINRLRAQFGTDAPTEFTYLFVSRKYCHTLAAFIANEVTFTTAKDEGLSFTYSFDSGELDVYEDRIINID